jgi:hypothetical protein
MDASQQRILLPHEACRLSIERLHIFGMQKRKQNAWQKCIEVYGEVGQYLFSWSLHCQ